MLNFFFFACDVLNSLIVFRQAVSCFLSKLRSVVHFVPAVYLEKANMWPHLTMILGRLNSSYTK